MLALIMSLIVYNLVVCAYYRISHEYGSRRWLCWYDVDNYLNSCNIDFGSIKYPLTWRSNTFWFNAFSAMTGVIYLTGLLLHHRSSLIFGTLGYVISFIYDTYMIVVCLTETQLCLICSSNIISNRTYNILIGLFFVQLSKSLMLHRNFFKTYSCLSLSLSLPFCLSLRSTSRSCFANPMVYVYVSEKAMNCLWVCVGRTFLKKTFFGCEKFFKIFFSL
uniref:Uncharacterized protein n=1 Tax=Glossina austeni TaxID=7395 RepID=A0A1A9UQ10_GLOAU